MKNKKTHTLELALIVLGCACAIEASSQFKIEMASSSAGTTNDKSTNGTYNLYALAGQPIAYSSSVATEVHAGFMQVGSFVIEDKTRPVITHTIATAKINGASAATNSIVVNITDDVQLSTSRLWKRKLGTVKTYDSVDLVAGTGGSFTKPIDATMYDALGMEYYFTAKDAAGNWQKSPVYRWYVKTDAFEIPTDRIGLGIKAAQYKIFSMPYKLASLSVASVFDEVAKPINDYLKVGGYNTANNSYSENPDFVRGAGYWLSLRNTVAVKIDAETELYHRGNLFEMNLKNGWNLIGNPYPVEISWNDVKAFPGNTGAPSLLKIWNGSTGYGDGDALQPFQGGWVKADADVTIKIPFKGQTALGGRIQSGESTDLSEANWKIKLNIMQSELGNQLGAFGMNANSIDGMDANDDFNPPPIGGSPEINFSLVRVPTALVRVPTNQTDPTNHSLAKDIVQPNDEMVWAFQVKGNEEQSELSWSEGISTGGKDLVLLDEENLSVVDMAALSRYSFSAQKDHRFKIYFGIDAREKMKTSEAVIKPPYPNPVFRNEETTFRMALPEAGGNWNVRVDLFTSSGGAAGQYGTEMPSGFQEMKMKMNESLSPGLYFYHVRAYAGSSQKSFTGKIIIQ
jgi:hypothetical protein